MPGHEQQIERFDRLRGEFTARLAAVRALDEHRFVRQDWAERNEALGEDLSPRPASDFLRHPAILYQMFVADKYVEHEAPYVLRRLREPALAIEDPVGDPPVTLMPGTDITTSANTVHHLHHLLRFEDATGQRLSDFDTVVEWGGGYGNLAKLLLRLHGGSPTYLLIDTPVFAAIQWLYLASVMGPGLVVLRTEDDFSVTPGVVNVVPIGLARHLSVGADLFISTWALNESTAAAQDFVVDRLWFGADALLMAMHQGDPFEQVVVDAGAGAFPVGSFMPAQRYLLRASAPRPPSRKEPSLSLHVPDGDACG